MIKSTINTIVEECASNSCIIRAEIADKSRKVEWLNSLEYIDEDKSVKWNKEEINRQIEVFNSEINQLKKDSREVFNPCKDFIKQEIREYCFCENTINEIFDMAYAKEHDMGYHNVYEYAMEICDFVDKIIGYENKF